MSRGQTLVVGGEGIGCGFLDEVEFLLGKRFVFSVSCGFGFVSHSRRSKRG